MIIYIYIWVSPPQECRITFLYSFLVAWNSPFCLNTNLERKQRITYLYCISFMSFLSPLQKAKMYRVLLSYLNPQAWKQIFLILRCIRIGSDLLHKIHLFCIHTAAGLFHITFSLKRYSKKVQFRFSIHFLTVLSMLKKPCWRTSIVYSEERHHFKLIWALEFFFSCSVPHKAASFWHSLQPTTLQHLWQLLS